MQIHGSLGVAALGAAVFGAMLAVTGCYSLGSDCTFNYDCQAGGGGGGTSTGGGGSGGAPPGCIPSNNSTPVDDGCGVFVSSTKGEDSNVGTKAKPVSTLTTAFALANGKPVYLCGETLLETVQIDGKVALYGGLDCATDWKYDAAKQTILTASNDMVPVSVSSGARLDMYDVNVQADDALAPGGSSIGILAEADAEVNLTRCTVQAGKGADGASGDEIIDPAQDGGPGPDGVNACVANQAITADPPTNNCSDVQSIGGAAGIGLLNSGGAGSPGLPDGAMNGGLGEGGTACTDGGIGDNGTTGTPGDGATSLGSLKAGIGFAGSAGGDGKSGAPGQGGGGGGGAKGGTGSGKCSMAGTAAGASGGAGGSGGCGGLGGKGGTGAGASIGIVSLAAKLTFSDVTIEAKGGGNGGNGGPGQLGGIGGTGGMGGSKAAAINLKNGCNGGNGGKGGDGGKGGGGRGGHSLGIAHTGASPDTTGATITVGAAGTGGTGEGAESDGSPGVAEKVQAFN